MPIKKINEFPEGSGSLSNDDVFLFMDNPNGSAITKKISLSQISSLIGGNQGSSTSPISVYNNGYSYTTNDVVIYNNDIWFCYDGSNLSAGYPPPSRPANWKKIGATQSVVVDLGSVSGTINTDANSGNIFDLILAASGTLSNPTNGTDGQTLRWRITYANSGIPLSLGNNFKIPNVVSTLSFSRASGVTDLLGATYDASRTKWDIIGFVPGY